MSSFPRISSVAELEVMLELPRGKLQEIIVAKSEHYKHRLIPKRRSRREEYINFKTGYRHLDIPSAVLMYIQRWILKAILHVPDASANATAYIPGKNLLANVNPHIQNRYFMCLDLVDFFGSIKEEKIRLLFNAYGYSLDVAATLAELCTHEGCLPQGAPTSPMLSNLVLLEFDAAVQGLAYKEGVVYTRYADDMTFSAPIKKVWRPLAVEIEACAQGEGFSINWKKYHIMDPGRRCKVTGLVKDIHGRRFSIGRKEKRRMRSIMLAAENKNFKDPQYKTTASIDGWLSYLKSVDEKGYGQMLRYRTSLSAKKNNEPIV